MGSVCVLCVFSHSVVSESFATPSTVVLQAPTWDFQARILSGLPFPLPGNLPHLEIKRMYPVSPSLAGEFFTIESWEAHIWIQYVHAS